MSDQPITIESLVRAYATAIEYANAAKTTEQFIMHMNKSDTILAQILSCYQPRPEGSVTATQEEYDTLTKIASLVDEWRPTLYDGDAPLRVLNELDTLLNKWRETLPEGE